MRLSNKRINRANLKGNSFWETINKISITLGLSIDELSEMMEVSVGNIISLQKNQKDPRVSAAMNLCKHINVGFESLMMNQFDYKVMAQQYFINSAILPEKYTAPALSCRRTVIPILDYAENISSWEHRALILRRFQMTEAMFTDPNATMNIRFGVDLCNYLYSYYKNENVLENMGRHSAQMNKNSILGQELSKSKNHCDIFENMSSGLVSKYIEKNYIWKITSLNKLKCTLEGRPSEEMLAMPFSKELLNPVACMIRSGFISYLPRLADLNTVTIRKSSCVANGDDFCRFHVDFNQQQFSNTLTTSNHFH